MGLLKNLLMIFFLFWGSARAEVVKVGAFINDIQSIDLDSHSYSVDVYVWFKWRDRRFNPAHSVEFMNSYERWGQAQDQSFDDPDVLPTGEYYQVLRVQGRFTRKFNLAHYPFDRQTLLVAFEDKSKEVKDVTFVSDKEPVTLNPSLTLPGYVFGAPRLDIVENKYPTTFGDVRDNASGTNFSRVLIELPIRRPILTYAVKLMIPILCVVFCAALMFLFKPSYVDARVGIGITALLTIVALQITLNEDLPEIDYLVLIDKIYLAAYIYVIAGLAVVVRTTWMLERSADEMQKAIQLDRVSLVILTLGYLMISGLVMMSAFY